MTINIDNIKNMFDLKGKTAIVTGGSGTLGKALATGLAAYGANVVIIGRTKKTLDEAKKEIESTGGKAEVIVCDTSVEDQVMKMMDSIMVKFNKIDILVTAAGIAKRFPAEDFPLEDFEQVLDINLKGTFIVCKHIGKVMKKQGYGKIITISSVRGFAGHPGGYAAYGVSKAGVDLLTKQLATEWAKYNINVNAIAPTIFWTPLTQQVLEDEKLKHIFLSRIPLGRAAEVDDITGTAVFLASGASDFITGQIIYVDGGCTAG